MFGTLNNITGTKTMLIGGNLDFADCDRQRLEGVLSAINSHPHTRPASKETTSKDF